MRQDVSARTPILTPGEGEDRVAWAALVVLRAIARDRTEAGPRGVRVLPDSAILDDTEAVARLSALPKPVACRARERDGVLELDCRPLADEVENWALTVAQPASFASMADRISSDSSVAAGRLLVIGEGEAIIVGAAELRRLFTEYAFMHTQNIVGETPEFFGFRNVDAVHAERFSASPSYSQVRILG